MSQKIYYYVHFKKIAIFWKIPGWTFKKKIIKQENSGYIHANHNSCSHSSKYLINVSYFPLPYCDWLCRTIQNDNHCLSKWQPSGFSPRHCMLFHTSYMGTEALGIACTVEVHRMLIVTLISTARDRACSVPASLSPQGLLCSTRNKDSLLTLTRCTVATQSS